MSDETKDENAIPFPARMPDVRTKLQEERDNTSLSRKQFERFDATARNAFDKKIVDRARMNSEAERITVAGNLWRILDELERGPKRVSKKQVLHKAGFGSDPDSTKRLPYFALDPGLPFESKRAKLLTKGIARYLRIIKAPSQLSGNEEWDLTLRLVENTKYYPTREEMESADYDLNSEGWQNIAAALQASAERASNRHKLPQFFKTVRDLSLEEPFLGSQLVQRGGAQSRKPVSFEDIALPALVRTDELPPHPKVGLGKILVCDPIFCTIVFGLGEGRGDKASELRNSLLQAGLEAASLDGVAIPVLQVSLGLLPLGGQYIISPVLCLTSSTSIYSADSFSEFVPFGGYEWRVGDQVGDFVGPIEQDFNFLDTSMKGPKRFIAFDEQSASFVDCAIGVVFESGVGEAYARSPHSRSAVGGTLVGRFDNWARECLSKEAGNAVTMSPFSDYCWQTAALMVASGVNNAGADFFSFFPGDTMAALLERSLFAAPESVRLDRLLEQSAADLTQKLEASIKKARTHRRKWFDEFHHE